MSLPDHVLSTEVVPQTFAPPRDIPPTQLIAYDYGGININDPSAGLQVKIWRCRWESGNFIVDADGVPDTVIYSASDISDFDITFDQNMQPFLAFTQGGVAKFRWFDATVPGFVVITLPGAVTPKCQLDDKRPSQISNSDIILAYVRDFDLYYREQRDRFGVEYLLKDGAGPRLRRIGMGQRWRFLFEMEQV
jgi:hypothetical protein